MTSIESKKIDLVENGAELRPARREDIPSGTLRLGIDVGSTTVKLAVLDEVDLLGLNRGHAVSKSFIRAQP